MIFMLHFIWEQVTPIDKGKPAAMLGRKTTEPNNRLAALPKRQINK